MIAFKWYVTVISTAALLAGCLTNEKKKNPDKNSSGVIKKHSVLSPGNTEKEISPNAAIAYNGKDDERSAILTHYPGDPITASSLTEEKGSATFSLLPLKKSFSNAALDFLLPLHDAEDQLLFSQLGARRYDGRNIINIGIGQRHFFEHWMLGYNSFYDAQVSTNHHQRFGLGLELWSQNLKFSANGYWRLSGWKNSYLLKGSEERVANGYDVNLNAYLPFYPQLGGRVKYERYFGNEVTTLNYHERYKNPSALTVGLIYNPVPLITLGWDHSRWNNGKAESKANLTFNYRLNVPLSKQVNPQFNSANLSIAGKRFDPVERNNNIVLEYKIKETVDFRLPTDLKGVESERRNIDYTITGKFPLDRIDWDDSALLTQGGKVVAVSKSVYQVQLPAFNPHGVNQFIISGVAYDTAGHASNRSTMTIHTQPARPLLTETHISQEATSPSPVQIEIADEHLIPNAEPVEPEAEILVNSVPDLSTADDISMDTTAQNSAIVEEIIDGLESSPPMAIPPPPPPPPPPIGDPMPSLSSTNEINTDLGMNKSVSSGSRPTSTSSSVSDIADQIKSFDRNSLKKKMSSYQDSSADISTNSSSQSSSRDKMELTLSSTSTNSSLSNGSFDSSFSPANTSTMNKILDLSALKESSLLERANEELHERLSLRRHALTSSSESSSDEREDE